MIEFIDRSSLVLLTLTSGETSDRIYQSPGISRDKAEDHYNEIFFLKNAWISLHQKNHHHHHNCGPCISHGIVLVVFPYHDHRDDDVVLDDYRDDRLAYHRRCDIHADRRDDVAPFSARTPYPLCDVQVGHYGGIRPVKTGSPSGFVFYWNDDQCHRRARRTCDERTCDGGVDVTWSGNPVCCLGGWILRHTGADHSDWTAWILRRKETHCQFNIHIGHRG